MQGPVVVVIQYCQCVYRNPQTAKLEIGPACQRHIGVIFADMEIDYDKLAAAIFTAAATTDQQQMTLQWILVYRQPARKRVVRNFAIGGTSCPEGRGVGVGGGYILGLSHKRGVIF